MMGRARDAPTTATGAEPHHPREAVAPQPTLHLEVQSLIARGYVLRSRVRAWETCTETRQQRRFSVSDPIHSLPSEESQPMSPLRARILVIVTAGILPLSACDLGTTVEVAGNWQVGCEPVGAVSAGGSVSGDLGPGCTIDEVFFIDPWMLDVQEGGSYVITLMSDDFDTVLYLHSEDGTFIQSDDDGAGGLNSELRLSLSPGLYSVGASSFGEEATGRYQLSVSR